MKQVKEQKNKDEKTVNNTVILKPEQRGNEEILAYLQKNEATNLEILKSLKFIKRYYFWRSLFNSFKIAILVLVLVLGVVSWNNISTFFRDFSTNIENSFSQVVEESVKEKLNLSN
jgi:flagellar biosynthesis protein FlhB